MHEYWFYDGCEHKAATRSGGASWGCSAVQEISGETDLLDDDQNRHHIAVSVVGQFLSTPRTTHLEPVMRILRYLKKILKRALLYSDHGHTRVALSDADWVRCPSDRRSITWYYFFLERNPVLWKSKKQSVVSRFSAETEYMAMTNVTLELIWILLADVSFL